MNKSGFGLIELLITLGLMSIVVMGNASIVQYFNLQTKTNDIKNNAYSLTGSLISTAQNAVACTQAVTQKTQQFTGSVEFDLPDGTQVYSGANLANYSLSINSFYLQNYMVVSSGGGVTVYYGTLYVQLVPTVPVLGAKQLNRIVSSVYLSVDQNNNIISCGPTLPNNPAPTASPTPVPSPTPNPSPDPGNSGNPDKDSNGDLNSGHADGVSP